MVVDRQNILRDYHDIGIRLLFQEQSFLFQRAHFFLIANSFLVAAFAAIYKIDGGSPLINALPIIGIIFAILQFFTSLWNALRVKRCRDYVFDIEKESNEFPEVDKAGIKVRECHSKIKPPFCDALSDLDPINRTLSPITLIERWLPPSVFTWLSFPVVFLCFWIWALFWL